MNDKDYLFVLKALQEIPFGVGLRLLTCFLQGDKNNERIKKHSFDKLPSFGCLVYSKQEIKELVDNLFTNGLICQRTISGFKFGKVFEITQKGIQEIQNPQFFKKKVSYKFQDTKTIITEEDKKIFEAFGEFLKPFNDEQKKTIINKNNKILCIAGAGSGKTTVLTKRIEFLIKYQSIKPEKLLAITFTRKARQEMAKRLKNIACVNIETFNSFCEKILNKYNDLIYDRQVRMASYKDKIIMINKALKNFNLDMQKAIDVYFSTYQKNGKTREQLARIFMNDCFFILDYFKFKNKPINFSEFQSSSHSESAQLVFQTCKYIEAHMKKHGLRDYADQLVEVIKLFDERKDLIPEFEHVLIDEYQDINSTQHKLIELLNSKNLFCVGDPRQAIFGWRGSDVKYILNFKRKHPDCEITTLTTNYRSSKKIVDLVNYSIKNMKLPDLKSIIEDESKIHLLNFSFQESEFEFIIQKILALTIPRNEIFVLARTNKQLIDLSRLMKARGIKHVVRNDDLGASIESKEDEATLSTIHSIKGLEAEVVFVIGCNNSNFPCKASDHPVIDMVKVDEYDKEEEEKRLFYVAMSRAKKQLYLTYTGKNSTNFITQEMINLVLGSQFAVAVEIISKSSTNVSEFTANSQLQTHLSGDIVTKLKEWRRKTSIQQSVPAYIIMHDKTLIEIAQELPKNKIELEFIKGMGPNKIQNYGDEIVKIVNEVSVQSS